MQESDKKDKLNSDKIESGAKFEKCKVSHDL